MVQKEIFSIHTGKNIGWKMSFYLFIAIYFYLNIVCKNIVCELGLKAYNWGQKFSSHFVSERIPRSIDVTPMIMFGNEIKVHLVYPWTESPAREESLT